MNIRTATDLKNNYKKISTLAKKTQQPIYITVNGKEDTALLDVKLYELLIETLELQKKLHHGIKQIRNGQTCTIDEVEKDLGL